MNVMPSGRSGREHLALAVVMLGVFITRVLALASSPWEWDEILFILAVEEYDIGQHRPHPPGYPLFVGLAKLIHLFVQDEFAALRAVTLLGAILLPLGLWQLMRLLGFSPFVQAAAVLLVSFTTVIWFYGGTAFSDVPALTVTIFAAASLLLQTRGLAIDTGSALLIAATIGFRPQNALIIVPFMIASIWQSRNRWRRALVTSGIAALATMSIYGIAFAASGSIGQTIRAVQHQAGYVVDVDSARNPIRPPMDELWEEFLLDPFPTDAVAWGMYAFAAIGAIYGMRRHKAAVVILLCAFVPISLLSMLLLAFEAAERYSIAYVPLVGILAAVGIEAVSSRAPRPGSRNVARVGLLAVCVISLGWRSWAAIQVPRNSPSPPVAAVQHVLAGTDGDDVIVMDGSFTPFAVAYVPHAQLVDEYSGRDTEGYLIELTPTVLDVPHFRFEEETLRRFARRRYFDVWVARLDLLPRFETGWYGVEWDGKTRTASRWMSGSGAIALPGGAETRCATLRFELPSQVATGGVRGEIDGGEVSVERVGNELTMHVRLQPCDGCFRVLELEAESFVPAESEFGSDDQRELGALLRSISVNFCD